MEYICAYVDKTSWFILRYIFISIKDIGEIKYSVTLLKWHNSRVKHISDPPALGDVIKSKPRTRGR